jgi:hypothetical protein
LNFTNLLSISLLKHTSPRQYRKQKRRIIIANRNACVFNLKTAGLGAYCSVGRLSDIHCKVLTYLCQ